MEAMAESLSLLFSGLVLGLSAGLAPGPLTTLLLGETLRHGRGAGLRIACVPLVSDLPIILLSVFLLSRLSSSGPILGGISFLGGLFVSYLAYESLTTRPPAEGREPSPPSSLRRGLVTNLLNPHPYLFWITVGAPLMLRPGKGAAALFVAAFYVCLVGAKLAMAMLVARFRDLLVNRYYLLANRFLGLILILFAFALFGEGLRLSGLLD
jgi:threonine/homoserine/homoserine lactone efflux protein